MMEVWPTELYARLEMSRVMMKVSIVIKRGRPEVSKVRQITSRSCLILVIKKAISFKVFNPFASIDSN